MRAESCDSEDYYEIKEVDRKLSYFLITSSSIICDVGGASGIDIFPQAMLGSFGVCLDINRKAVKLGKILSKRKSIQDKVEFMVANATNLPFRNCSFDLVNCFSVLDHLPCNRYVSLSVHEFSRVVKDSGYVVITVPNRFFIIGTLSRKMKRLLDSARKEIRFTPKEMQEIMILSGLTPIAFYSKYPTKIGNTVLKYNLPKVVRKFPRWVINPFFSIAENLFQKMERRSCFRLFGARFGYLSKKFVEDYERRNS